MPAHYLWLLTAMAIAVVVLGGCVSGQSPYWDWGNPSNRSWQEDQSQMRGMLYASTFAADVAGDLNCAVFPETVEKTVAYQTVWIPAEFKRGFQKKCAELMIIRQAARDASEAKALAEKTAGELAAKKAAKKARRATAKRSRCHCVPA